MNICLRHGQAYPADSHCPYCGPPKTWAASSAEHVLYWGVGGDVVRYVECPACKHPDSTAAHTCGLRDRLIVGN